MVMKWRKRLGTAMMMLGLAAAGSSAASLIGPGVFPAYASDKAVETVYLGEPKHVWWETDTIGKWSSVKKAHEYQVRLYIADDFDWEEDDENIISFEALEEAGAEAVMTKRTSDTYCDFSEYMNDLHSYIFLVRATPKVSEQAYVADGDWAASKELDFRGKQVQGITTGKWRNYLEGSRYEDEDGEFLSGGWQLIRGCWYYLNEEGYRQTGWQLIDGCYYYLGEFGQMTTGWFVWEDNWYYANKDGQMQTGWVMPEPGHYYYLNEDGTMAHDLETETYWLDSDGLYHVKS